MYICHALINVLSTHLIHINLNTMFYTHYIRHDVEKHMHVGTHTCMHTHTYTRTHTQLRRVTYVGQQ